MLQAAGQMRMESKTPVDVRVRRLRLQHSEHIIRHTLALLVRLRCGPPDILVRKIRHDERDVEPKVKCDRAVDWGCFGRLRAWIPLLSYVPSWLHVTLKALARAGSRIQLRPSL